MNEPSVFDGPEGTLPKNTIHTVNNGTISDKEVMNVYHRDVHNTYGLFMSKATY
jgi:hypothetical protein